MLGKIVPLAALGAIAAWLIVGPAQTSPELSPGAISSAAAASHIGETATVEGVVGEVHTTGSGITFIDLDGSYPNQQFTGVIFAENAAIVRDAQSLHGKTVDLTGTVKLYRGSPEIILRSPNQISVR